MAVQKGAKNRSETFHELDEPLASAKKAGLNQLLF